MIKLRAFLISIILVLITLFILDKTYIKKIGENILGGNARPRAIRLPGQTEHQEWRTETKDRLRFIGLRQPPDESSHAIDPRYAR